MTSPIDAVVAIHNAFRADIACIDDAALGAARGKAGLQETVERFRFFNEVLAWHAHGEEIAVFPSLEAVAPLVVEAYERDHRGLDATFEALSNAVSARDALETARATAAFRFHLEMHLAKEEQHLFRIMTERLPIEIQAKAVDGLCFAIPQDRFAEVIAWMFPVLRQDDRENMVRVWQMLWPAESFGWSLPFIREAVGDDWAELCRRIPELPALAT